MTVADTSPLLAAVETTAARVSLLMRAAGHPGRTAIGTWTVGETASHLAHCYPAFARVFDGAFSVGLYEVDAHNAEVLEEDTQRDLGVLADRVDENAARYVQIAGGYADDHPVDFFTPMRVPASGVTATLLGEALVHGYDIATAEGLPWPIEPDHAILTLGGLVPVMVHFVDQEAAAGLRAGFEIRLRGASPQYWYFDDGELTIGHAQSGPVDCRIAADPATWLLMSYHRVGSTTAALRGKVRVWGRRPWLATRLGGIFRV